MIPSEGRRSETRSGTKLSEALVNPILQDEAKSYCRNIVPGNSIQSVKAIR